MIDNCTNLSNQDIGCLIDEINKGLGTIYYGKQDHIEFKYKGRIIAVDITYLKRYDKYIFYELRK